MVHSRANIVKWLTSYPKQVWIIALISLGAHLAVATLINTESYVTRSTKMTSSRAGSFLSAPPAQGTDAAEYDAYAWNMARGRGYRGPSPDVNNVDHATAYRPPGVSAVWAGIYAVAGHRYSAIRILHCVLVATTVFFVFEIGRSCFSERVGLAGSIIWSVFPTSLLYTPQLMSEALGVFWLLAVVAGCLVFAEHSSIRHALIAGISLGISVLTRPNTVVLVPLIIFWILAQFRKEPFKLLRGMAIPIASLLVVLPWTIRNYVVFKELVPLSTAGGSALLQGNNRVVVQDPNLYGYCVWDSGIPEYHNALVSAKNELARDRLARKFAMTWLLGHREKWGFLIIAKMRRAFSPILHGSSHISQLALLISWGPILFLFVLGAFPTLATFLRRRHPGWLIHLVILHFIIISIIFYGYSRYRNAVEPFCILIATACATSIYSRVRCAMSTTSQLTETCGTAAR